VRFTFVAALLLVAACKQDPDKLPIIPGGGGPGGNGNAPDAAVDGSDGGAFDGRVCLASDPRDLFNCAAMGAGNVTVTLGSATAITADDGSFSIMPPASTNLEWHASGTAIVTSVMAFGTLAKIPALSLNTFNDLLDSNGVLQNTGQGSIMITLVHGGVSVVGATVAATPPSSFDVFYDAGTATTWGTTATGAHGVAWIASEPVGAVDLTVTPSAGSASIVPAVPVEDGAITFVTAEVP
jgi:hypothetical protein